LDARGHRVIELQVHQPHEQPVESVSVGQAASAALSESRAEQGEHSTAQHSR
jgi:hypothetical protein